MGTEECNSVRDVHQSLGWTNGALEDSDCRTLGFDDSLSGGSMGEWVHCIVQNNLGMLILKNFFTITLELYLYCGEWIYL